MKKIPIFLFLILTIMTSSGVRLSAEETAPKEAAGEPEAAEPVVDEGYKFPVIRPEVSVFGGYRFVHFSGSEKAGEYEFLHNSVTAGGEARIFSFPHRLHLEIDVKNRKDYFGDISYAFKDIVLFRGINRTLFHNLDTFPLIDLNPATTPATSPAGPTVDVRDPGNAFGVKSGMNSVFLRLKTPDFPFHVYIDGNLIEREGTQQQRSLQGAGYFNSIVRTSQPRNVDWETKNLVIGANSHLGPVEIDISHGEKRFDVSGDKVLFDAYGAATSGQVVVLNGGVFPHNAVPELKGSSNTLKLHTSYTGGLVASATVSHMERKNEDSNVKADYFIGAGEVTWMPMTRLTFFLKYRHKEVDIDNSDGITFANVCSPSNNPSNTYACQIKPSISSITDTISGTVRYRLTKKITLRAEYSYEDVRRKDAEEWFIPDSTQRNTASLSADVRIARNLNLRAKFSHRDIDSPAVNIEPDRADEGRISLSWIPWDRLQTLVSYRVAKEKRNTLRFVHQEPVPPREEVVVESPGEREMTRDRFLWSISLFLLKELTVTSSFSYLHDRGEEDLAYHDLSGNHFFDPGVPVKNTAQNYAFDIHYRPEKTMTFTGGVSHTRSSGNFHSSDINLTQPVSIASFSEIKTRETVYSLSGEYAIKGGFTAGVHYMLSDFDDVLDNPNDDVDDGEAHIVLLVLSKRW